MEGDGDRHVDVAPDKGYSGSFGAPGRSLFEPPDPRGDHYPLPVSEESGGGSPTEVSKGTHDAPVLVILSA